eukprot:11169012-Lingulodinium_polyedra.AAC.1
MTAPKICGMSSEAQGAVFGLHGGRLERCDPKRWLDNWWADVDEDVVNFQGTMSYWKHIKRAPRNLPRGEFPSVGV